MSTENEFLKSKNENITFFCDLDGTLCYYQPSYEEMLSKPMEVLPGVLEKLNLWRNRGDKIVITTARMLEDKERTEEQLAEVGIIYDAILFGNVITSGLRAVLNDAKSYMKTTALGITLERNEGLENLGYNL